MNSPWNLSGLNTAKVHHGSANRASISGYVSMKCGRGGNMTNHTLALKDHLEVAPVASAYILLAGASHMTMHNFKGVGKYNPIMCLERGKLRY